MVITKALRLFESISKIENPTDEQIQQRETQIANLKAKAKEIWGAGAPEDNIFKDELVIIDDVKYKVVERFWPSIEVAIRWCEYMRTDEHTTSCEILPE